MVAVVRGAPRGASKPRPKGPATYAKPAPRPAKGRGYAPGKLGAVANVVPQRLAAIGAGVILVGALLITAATGDRPERIGAAFRAGMAQNLAGIGFKLNKVHIEGIDNTAKRDILRATGLYKNAPIFGERLDVLQQRVEQVGWVKQARVVRLLPDTLVFDITPRPTLAIWQNNGVAKVIDAEGHVISEADPGRFAGLPLVVGRGANEVAGTILPILIIRPKLMDRLEALVRVDSRRWDLRLKDGSLIQLPAVGEDSALIQLDQLDQRSRVLELGFERIDLRDPETIAVRPRAQPAYLAPAVGAVTASME